VGAKEQVILRFRTNGFRSWARESESYSYFCEEALRIGLIGVIAGIRRCICRWGIGLDRSYLYMALQLKLQPKKFRWKVYPDYNACRSATNLPNSKWGEASFEREKMGNGGRGARHCQKQFRRFSCEWIPLRVGYQGRRSWKSRSRWNAKSWDSDSWKIYCQGRMAADELEIDCYDTASGNICPYFPICRELSKEDDSFWDAGGTNILYHSKHRNVIVQLPVPQYSGVQHCWLENFLRFAAEQISRQCALWPQEIHTVLKSPNGITSPHTSHFGCATVRLVPQSCLIGLIVGCYDGGNQSWDARQGATLQRESKRCIKDGDIGGYGRVQVFECRREALRFIMALCSDLIKEKSVLATIACWAYRDLMLLFSSSFLLLMFDRAREHSKYEDEK